LIIPVKIATADAEGKIFHEVKAGQLLAQLNDRLARDELAIKKAIHDQEPALFRSRRRSARIASCQTG
jgi:hypothetical protein